MNPTVSVIIPFYNAEDYLAEAIQSVFDQEFTDWELLLVNDGSEDGSEEVALSFVDPRIRYFAQKNQGVSVARNLALTHMKGDYFCFLDADDKFPSQSLSSRVKVMEEYPEVSFVDGEIHLMDNQLEKTCEIRKQGYEGPPFDGLLRIDNSCFFGITWMIRRVEGKHYKFKRGLTHGEDLLFYMDISRDSGHYKSVMNAIYCCRIGNASAMSNLAGLWKGYKMIY